MILSTLLFPILFLIGAVLTASLKTAALKVEPKYLTRDVKSSILPALPFSLFGKLFKNQRIHPGIDFLSLTYFINLVGFSVSSSYFIILQSFNVEGDVSFHQNIVFSTGWFFLSLLIIFAIAIGAISLFYLFAYQAHLATLKLFSFFAFLYLTLFFPITFPILWIKNLLTPDYKPIEPLASDKFKTRLQELLQDQEFIDRIDPRDKKIVKALAQFGDLVCREIMVPRVYIECLEENTTLDEALNLFIKEGYSRLPIYQESIDHMTGILLYKDLMKFIEENLDAVKEKLKTTTVHELSTPPIFAPENKKIRELFHEMRTQRSHASIVVNEYGCTEGLVTIEDILEEIIGSEIQDEYDIDEETLFHETGDQSWIVDAKMLIIDAERELGITFPHHPEYETIGGYIFHVTGIIPVVGSVVHLDQYNIRVLSSDKRQIHKVKITKEVPSSSLKQTNSREKE